MCDEISEEFRAGMEKAKVEADENFCFNCKK
jgi:hypothetical protein